MLTLGGLNTHTGQYNTLLPMTLDSDDDDDTGNGDADDDNGVANVGGLRLIPTQRILQSQLANLLKAALSRSWTTNHPRNRTT